MNEEQLKAYSRALDEMAWCGNGSMIELARMAKALGRNVTEDLAERKLALVRRQENGQGV